MKFSEYSKLMLPEVEDQLHIVIDTQLGNSFPELKLMQTYHLGWSGEGAGPKATGKRIRPLLLLLCCESAGGDWHTALPAAAAVELLHNFSLIHDDVQDQSDLRRGRPTVWAKWGEAQAINAGDLMFTLSNLAILRLSAYCEDETIVKAVSILNSTCVRLTQGQYLDMAYESAEDLQLQSYWPMVAGKTAALLEGCSDLGALVAGAHDSQRALYRQFAFSLGLAFQVWDDWLGIWGDVADLGKSIDSDLVARKKTLPVLYGLSLNGKFAQRWAQGPIHPEEVLEIAQMLADEGVKDYAKREADRLTAESLTALHALDNRNEATLALEEMAGLLLGRRS